MRPNGLGETPVLETHHQLSDPHCRVPFTGKHVIAALVLNEAGVLAGVSNMFAARNYNIDSLVVGRTEIEDLSRMTITVIGDDKVITQVQKQLEAPCPLLSRP